MKASDVIKKKGETDKEAVDAKSKGTSGNTLFKWIGDRKNKKKDRKDDKK
jgi:hypothetical protein